MSHPSRIVQGPTVRDDGSVGFLVEVDHKLITVTTSPLGIAASTNLGLDVYNIATRLIADFVQAANAEMWKHYREAAQLRRAAGKPPLVGAAPLAGATVKGSPERRPGGAVFLVDAAGVEVRVQVFTEGGLVDDCDDWDRLSPEQRDGAMTAALQYIWAHPVEASDLGLDVALLREFWT